MPYITTSSLSILVNGGHLQYFSLSRVLGMATLSPPTSSYYAWSILRTSFSMKLTLITGRESKHPRMALPSHTFSLRMISSFSLRPQRKIVPPLKTPLKSFAPSLVRKSITRSTKFPPPPHLAHRIMQVERKLCISSCKDFCKYFDVPILTDQRSNRGYNFLIDSFALD